MKHEKKTTKVEIIDPIMRQSRERLRKALPMTRATLPARDLDAGLHDLPSNHGTIPSAQEDSHPAPTGDENAGNRSGCFKLTLSPTPRLTFLCNTSGHYAASERNRPFERDPVYSAKSGATQTLLAASLNEP